MTESAQDLALAKLLLHREIESFLCDEAHAVDNREFERWLEFFSDDVRYWIPQRKNLASKRAHLDIGDSREAAWVDDDIYMMRMRVAQIRTGVHWAEEPMSRVTHLLTNVRVLDNEDGTYEVSSNILVHRNRLETETDVIVARREDKIRRFDDSLRIYFRKVILNHHTLPAKNLSFFI